MIGSIKGKVKLKESDYLLIENNAIGYKVLVSEKIFSRADIEKDISLYTYTHVKEDALELFGFLEHQDLKLFENLISVNGVGVRTAMSIFSFSSREEVINAVLKGDVAFFTRVPRLGKKNAQKIIIELKSKFKDTNSLDLSGSMDEADQEIYEALKTFGFSRREIDEAVKKLPTDIVNTNEKIKTALKFLGK